MLEYLVNFMRITWVYIDGHTPFQVDLAVAAIFALYVGVARLCVGRARVRRSYAPFAVVNVFFFFALCFLWAGPTFVVVPLYVALMGVHYVLLRRLIRREAFPWILVAWPLCLLLLVQNAEPLVRPIAATELGGAIIAGHPPLFMFVGLSYVAFRTSRLVVDLRRRREDAPSLGMYMAYVFFPPIMQAGPITRFHTFVDLYKPSATDVLWAIVRILFGLTKFAFIGLLANQLSYEGLFFDGHSHGGLAFVISAVAYMVYLYANFSGYCDFAVGMAALLGIRIDENFDRPFSSRNLQEFWTRFHITLGGYLRDMLFTPLSAVTLRSLPERFHTLGLAGASIVVFLAMGLWHGQTWPLAVYGLICGVGVAATMLYDDWLRRRFMRKQVQAYRANPVIRAVAVAATILYMSGALFFMANSAEDIRIAVRILAGGASRPSFEPVRAQPTAGTQK